MYRILHIAAHYGGGIGSTILGYLSVSKHINRLIALGYTTDGFLERIKHKAYYSDHAESQYILDIIPEYDIVIIHYWNHPLLLNFLIRHELPPCRLIVWGHVSGFHAPDVYPQRILDYPDIFVFTSYLSYELVKDRTKFMDIWSTGILEEYKNITPKAHQGFNVGYIGTVDYAKMHPQFVEMCNQIDIPDVKFIVIGETKERELKDKVKGNDKFEILGWVESLIPYYEVMDVFGYPLNPDHFGTCDLALQETLAAGIVPVVFNNPMEKTIVKHMETGIVVKSKYEYIKAIEELYHDKDLRTRLSENAKTESKFSLEKLNADWEAVFKKVISLSKSIKRWLHPKDIFIESLGNFGKMFADDNMVVIKKLMKRPRWQTISKGTVHNYLSYFNDPYLEKWSKL